MTSSASRISPLGAEAAAASCISSCPNSSGSGGSGDGDDDDDCRACFVVESASAEMNDRGATLHLAGDLDGAMACYERALQILLEGQRAQPGGGGGGSGSGSSSSSSSSFGSSTSSVGADPAADDALPPTSATAAPSSLSSSSSSSFLLMPRPDVDSDDDSGLIGMGRFVSPIHLRNARRGNAANFDGEDATAIVLFNVSLIKHSRSQYSVARELLELALLDLDKDMSDDDDDDEEADDDFDAMMTDTSDDKDGRRSRRSRRASSPLLRMAVLLNLGMAHYRLGRYAEAADRFDEASALPGSLLLETASPQYAYYGYGYNGADDNGDTKARRRFSVRTVLRCLAYSLANGARARDAIDRRSDEALALAREAAGLCETLRTCYGGAGSSSSSSSTRSGDRDGADADAGADAAEAARATKRRRDTCDDGQGEFDAILAEGVAYVEAVIRHRRGELGRAEELYRLCADRACRSLYLKTSTSTSSPNLDVHVDVDVVNVSNALATDETTSPSQRSSALRAAAALHGLGRASFERRRLAASIGPLRAAWSLRSKNLGESHVESIDSLYALGRALHDAEELVDALAVYERAYRLQRSAWGAGHVDALRTLCNVARIHRACGRGLDALEACEEAARAGRESLGGHHPFVLDMLAMKAMVLREIGQREDALVAFADLVRLAETAAGRDGRLKAADFLAECTRGPCFVGRSPGAAAA